MLIWFDTLSTIVMWHLHGHYAIEKKYSTIVVITKSLENHLCYYLILHWYTLTLKYHLTVIVLTFMRRLITLSDLSYCFCRVVECSEFCKSDFISKNELRIKSLECNGREIWITFDHTSNLLHQPWPKHVSMLPLGMNVLK